MDKIKIDINLFNSEQEIEDMYQEYLTCPEARKYLNRIGITDDMAKRYIVKIYDFIQDYKYCSHCPGPDKCKKANPLLTTHLTCENGVVDRDLIPCKEVLKETKVQSKFIFKDYDSELDNLTLRDIDHKASSVKKDIISQFNKYVKGKDDKWMYIYGGNVSGKSFIASIMANYLARNMDKTIGFINVPYRFEEINSYYYKDVDSYNEMLENLCTVDILFMDEFGEEKKNEIVRNEILSNIINYRKENKLMTVFTSKETLEEVMTKYATNLAASKQAIQIGKAIKKQSKIFNLDAVKGVY